MTAKPRAQKSITFYPSDYAGDDELAACSMAAQGFWMRCLCLAARHEGYVLVGGRAASLEDLAHATRVRASEVGDVAGWIDELVARRVCDVTEEGHPLGDVLNAPGSNAGVDAQFWSRKLRQVLVGFASGQPGSDNNGACVWLPSAFLATDPAKLDTGGERLRQVLTFRPGPPAVDGAGNYLPSVAIGVGA